VKSGFSLQQFFFALALFFGYFSSDYCNLNVKNIKNVSSRFLHGKIMDSAKAM